LCSLPSGGESFGDLIFTLTYEIYAWHGHRSDRAKEPFMIRLIRIVVGTAGLAALFTFVGTAHVLAADEGQVAFNTHCRTCHSTKEGDNRLGPSLHNIYGSKAGASAGYSNYSQGLASSGITWDEANLNRFLENPDQVVSSNNMKPYKGISDESVRKQIIEFLKSESRH
jgi:cytochrome c